jgi:cytochrome c oxidase subunit 2
MKCVQQGVNRMWAATARAGLWAAGAGLWAAGAVAALMATAGFAVAEDTRTPGGFDLLPAASQMMAEVRAFDYMINIIITAITLFVLALLVWVVLRYNRRANPTPKTFTHNTTLEVVWTAIPVLILVVISVFSFPLLIKEETIPKADLRIKAIGNQWNWSFEYPDFKIGEDDVVRVDNALPLSEEDAKAQNRPYLLATDKPIYVPLGSVVELTVTASDVIHSFALPDFAVKEDAIPGRLNQGWFHAEKLGTFYGQCSELCGIKHAFMPIELRVVERPQFEAWVREQGWAPPVAEAPPAAPAAVEPAAPAAGQL